MPQAGPLAGLTVIDLTRLAPGPFATMLLGDLGANVVTIEPPSSRTEGQGHAGVPLYGTIAARRAGINPLFRSRRSIVINLKKPEGTDLVLRLAGDADVFLEGFRPGVADRLGVGYDAVRRRNERIIYCSLTGYGQQGGAARRVGHDLNYLAAAGLLAMTSRGEGPPAAPANVVADLAAGGLLAAFGILAAVHGRRETGTGTYIDSNMVDGVLGMLASMEAWRLSGVPDPSWGRGLLTGAAPFYDCYATADGRWVSVAAIEPAFFARLCERLGIPELISSQMDSTQWPVLRTALREAFGQRTLDDVMAEVAGDELPIAPVASLTEAFDEARAEGRVHDGAHLGPLPRMSAWRRAPDTEVAQPGQHTDEVLAGLGLTSAEIAALHDNHVVENPAEGGVDAR